MSQNCNCNCECGKGIEVPVTGLSLRLNTDKIGCECHLPPENLYVATDGDDSNDGLTPEAPFATIQAAVDSTAKYVVIGRAITINVAPGMYPEHVNINAFSHYPLLGITGKETEYPVVQGIYAERNITLEIRWMHIKGNMAALGDYYALVRIDRGALCRLTDCDVTGVGASSSYHLFHATTGGFIDLRGEMALTALDGIRYFFQLTVNSAIQVFTSKLHFSGKAEAIAQLVAASTLYFQGAIGPVTGSVTGKSYDTRSNSVILTRERPQLLPGTQSGTTETGGVIV